MELTSWLVSLIFLLFFRIVAKLFYELGVKKLLIKNGCGNPYPNLSIVYFK